MKQQLVIFVTIGIALFLSIQSKAQTTIWLEDFETGYSDNDVTAQDNNAPTGPDWTKTGTPSNWWRVESDQVITGSLSMSGRNLDAEMTWTSEAISISAYTNINVSLNLAESGGGGGEYIRTFYKLDNGSYTQFSAANGIGAFGTDVNSTAIADGDSLRIRVTMYNTGAGDRHRFDDVLVTGDLVPVTAIDGPGGVGGTDGTSELELWLSVEGNTYTDAGVTSAANGNSIQQWNDLSGSNNHAIQTVGGNKPTLITGAQNGFSALDFNGSTSRILSAGIDDNGQASIFVVFKHNTLVNNNDGIIHAGPAGNNFSGTGTDKSIGMWTTTSDGTLWGRGVESGGTSHNIPKTTTLSTGQYYVVTQDYDGSNITQYVDGTAAGSVGYNGTLKDWSDFGIGRQGSESLDGEIAEVVVFNAHQNLAQRIIIQNYLAAKYDLTLSSNEVYTQDLVANGDYDYEVAGIGQASDGSNHTDAQGTGIVRVRNATGLGNGEFLLWGHDNAPIAPSSNDVPSGLGLRLERTWRPQEFGGEVGTSLIVSFDLSALGGSFTADQLRLLIDQDNDGEFSDEIAGVGVISGATDVGSNIFEWTNIDFENNRRFSIGIATLGYLGPGGVGSIDGSDNLTMWLDANTITAVADGANMGTWSDQSGYGNNALVDVAAPNYFATGGGNGQPTVSFDDNNNENFRVVTNSRVIPTQAISVFVAGNYENASDNWASFINSSDDDNWDDGWGIGEDNGTGNMIHYIDDYNGTFCNTLISSNYGTDQVWALLYDTDDGVISGYKSESSCTDNFAGPMNYDLGRNDDLLIGCGPDNGGPNYFLTGDINEIALYDVDLNDAQRIIVTNYLAAKYGITLSANNVYNEDENGDYDFDVAGIGMAGDGRGHFDAQGTGIVRINNASDLGTNEYYMWGHDNGSLNSFGETDFPPTELESRIERVWRGSETGSVGTFDISFDLSGLGPIVTSDLRLALDLGNNGVFADEGSASFIAGATKNGDIYTWSGVTIGDNIRFTIGSVNQLNTPLPITLSHFEAKALHLKNVQLLWETQSEINNDYFTIERSVDAENWEQVARIKGAGTSTRILTYKSNDVQPYVGKSYYRLKQTDYNGESSFSEPQAVNVINVSEKLSVYPVPSSERITIESNTLEISNYRIYNIIGADLSNLVRKVIYSNGKLILDIAELEPGLYFFRTEKSTVRFIKN